MTNIFIYPNEEQLKQIKKEEIIISKQCQINLEDINKNYKNYRVLCCNEEALYYFHKFMNNKIEKPFSNECLSFYDKIEAKKLFRKYNINHIKCNDSSKKFPLIGKPNFGFASIGVKKIDNEKELVAYEKTFNNIIKNSEINNMKNIYFSDLQIKPIYEKSIKDGYFFSVPFFYDSKKDKITIFPVEGHEQIKTNTTDLYWSKFVYDEDSINKNIYNMIEELLYQVVLNFKINTSINMAEVMYDYEEDKINLIEFSPRVPGGRLSKLINYGSGINLDEISIKSFVEEEINIEKKLSPVQLVIEDTKKLDYLENEIESEIVFSKVFNKEIKYSITALKRQKIGLIPGRFAPLHRGHQFVFDKAKKEMDQVVVLIFDTNDICVPLKKRANWIRNLYPEFIVIEGQNCPDGHKYPYELGQKCAFIQNRYIKNILKDIDITHVYHSTEYGDSVSKALNAIEVMVDLDRNQIPVSGTMIRNNLEKYKEYLDIDIYKDYKKDIEK